MPDYYTIPRVKKALHLVKPRFRAEIRIAATEFSQDLTAGQIKVFQLIYYKSTLDAENVG